MTFIDILNNPESRHLVEQIEDILSSLDSYPEGDAILEEIRDNLITQLETDFGFTYQIH